MKVTVRKRERSRDDITLTTDPFYLGLRGTRR